MNMVILEIRPKHTSFENGSPGQTTMLIRFVSKFCVEPRSPFSNISHYDIVPWPECQPEFPDDADDGGDGAPTTMPSGKSPSP